MNNNSYHIIMPIRVRYSKCLLHTANIIDQVKSDGLRRDKLKIMQMVG